MTAHTKSGTGASLRIPWDELEKIIGAANVQRIRDARRPKRVLKPESYAIARGVLRGDIDMGRGGVTMGVVSSEYFHENGTSRLEFVKWCSEQERSLVASSLAPLQSEDHYNAS